MEFLITNSSRQDLSVLPRSAYLDLDIGDTNDFQIKVNLPFYDSDIFTAGNYLYCIGTEYGGILDDPEVSTADGNISFTGDTFRGMLTKKYILPPSGQDYKTISGELNSCISTLIGSTFGTLFTVESESTGVSVTNYQFDRYCSLLDGITKMLASVDYRLKIEAVLNSNTFNVKLSAVEIEDHSAYVETSQDSGLNFTIKQFTNKYNYMICLGQGELQNRTVRYLHLKNDGTVETVNSIPGGISNKIYLYDYPNAESTAELISSGTDKFSEINGSDSQKMTVRDGFSYELGDIVGGRDYVTGMTISQPITQKIVKLQDGILKVSYTVGDEI